MPSGLNRGGQGARYGKCPWVATLKVLGDNMEIFNICDRCGLAVMPEKNTEVSCRKDKYNLCPNCYTRFKGFILGMSINDKAKNLTKTFNR